MKPFKPPFANGWSKSNEDLLRRLSARKRFVPWRTNSSDVVPLVKFQPIVVEEDDEQEEGVTLPPGIEPLVLWQPEESMDGGSVLTPISVDSLLVQFLRPHQRYNSSSDEMKLLVSDWKVVISREGVQFMFRCVSGLQASANIFGCILADDMGLGKTLQSITLLYTLLCQGFDGKPMVKKAIIVTPTSLVNNWEAEIKKWVQDRVHLIALCESSREDILSAIENFTNPRSKTQVLIVSYETFRMHALKFSHSGSCDLLICDEAHRLKNGQTITNKALASLVCKRRILLSGTPMQNDLEEFYAMVNFTNPGILGDAAHFRRYYQAPILNGREPTASDEEKKVGLSRSEELSAIVNQIVEVVCCKLTPLQSELYNHFIQSKNVKRAITEGTKQSKILAYITALKKLCNHPKLIYDTIKAGNSGIAGFEDCLSFFPPEVFSGRSGVWSGGDGLWIELSGKMHVLARLLAQLRQKTDDRIVLVSNYTQTLDLFAQLCRERRYPYLRLDGSTSISKRQKLVNCFNDFSKDEFAFLLSSKAGGCGLNLIGGNRLVLFDPDWNPANDKQAAARVWRDGQKKRVYVYRFLSSGTIEEKVYQRQMSKEGLQKVIQKEQGGCDKGNTFSMEDLRDLFTYNVNARSEIHEKMDCVRCRISDTTDTIQNGMLENRVEVDCIESNSEGYQSGQNTADIGGFAEISGLHMLKSSQKQVGSPSEEDLLNWAHHSSPTSVPDVLFQAAAGDEVTFAFTNQIDGKLVPEESMRPLKKQGIEERRTSVNLKWPNSEGTLKHKFSKLSEQQLSLSHGRNPVKKLPLVSTKPIQVAPLKSIKSSLKDVTNLSWRSKSPLSRQLPLKRPCHVREVVDVVDLL
uniref:Protein CHROMATIN REMODELING 25 n=1 Tax=Chenopodium quinoa TaxID=63459 RepID=A0A803LE39_CHEQI